MASVRECFIPRPGYVYSFADYSGLELCTLAQTCLDLLGHSEMAEALKRGEDLHMALAADSLGISYTEAKERAKAGDPEVKTARQNAKASNFGYPGGLGASSFREYAEGYGMILTQAEAEAAKAAWFRKWPEMREYFRYIDSATSGLEPIAQLRSGRLRGGATYCSAANGFFQGLAADGAKEALWLVAKECYLPGTALYGCRPVFFIHDEIGMEVPYAPEVGGSPESASAATERLSEVMVTAMKKWTPDIPIKAEPVMIRRWYKGAEMVRLEGDGGRKGIIVPSKPVKVEKDGKKFTTWVADV